MENENTIPEPSLEESISYLLGKVPAPVRDFVLNELQSKTQELMGRYTLHVDQGGVLERELLLMLLGQEQPAEFVAALQEGGIAPETVQNLVTDINKEVFMKLRALESSAQPSPVAPIETKPAAPWPITQTIPAAPKVTAVPVPAYMPPPPSVPEPTPQINPAPSISQLSPEPVFPMVAPVEAPQPVVETVSTVLPPPSVSVFPPTPVTSPKISEVTVQSPQPIAAPSMPRVVSTPPPQLSANRDALHAVLKEYGVDPYREPAD